MAQRIGHSWAIGQKKYNNGLVILIKPASGSEKGEAYIATGYGLEGKLPDIICKRIVDEVMIPQFKNGDYVAGINAGALTAMKVATGEYKDGSFAKKTGVKGGRSPFTPLIILIVMAFIVMRGFRGRGNHHSIGHNIPIWPFLFMGGLGGFGGGGNDNSGGGFGGGDGGGFGGFGGGDFGGGGAGGSW
jgi:uncharacterized protein